MTAYQQLIDESRIAQFRQDRMQEAANERALEAMRAARQHDREVEPTRANGAVPRRSGLRHAWSELVSFMASFL